MSKTFTPTRQGNPCQLCDDTTGKCRQTTSTLLCMTLTDVLDTPPGFTFIGRTKDHLWGKWVVGQGQDWSNEQRAAWQRERQQRQVERARAEAQRQATALSALERDRYYQPLLDQLSLHPADQNALSARGLSAAQLQTWGVKSVEQWQRLEPPLPHTLPGVNLNGDQLNVAGAGFLCPLRDVNGLLVGFQLRLRVAESGGRYRWLTSATKKRPHGPTPHLPHGELPLAVHRPPQVPSTSAIALVEGTGPKPFLLCQRRGQVVVGAAGGQFASSPQTLQHTLSVLAAELGTQIIEFFPDAGAISNRQVMRQYRRTWKLLRQYGYQVRVAWWGQDTKAAPDIDELEALEAQTPLTWLTTAQLEVMAQPRLDWLTRLQTRLQRSSSPQVAAAALRRVLEGPDPNLVEYAAGDRLATWQQAVAQDYQFVLDQSPTGTGKSFDAGLVEPSLLQTQQVFYVSDQHRNPTVETLTAAQRWVDLEARHAGLLQETTPGGGQRIKRAASGETPQTPANCARTRLLGALRDKHVAGADTAALICGTCPLKEACTHAAGPGYGFLNQRQAALASPKLRAHPASLPVPQDYVYDGVALVWDEPGQSFVTKHDIQITLTDLEQTLTALLSYPALFAAIQPLATTLLPYLKGQQRLGRFGLSHTDVVATLAVPTVNVSALEQVLQPDLAFLNPTAVHGVDLADLPAALRKRFSERDAEVATQAQQRVLKQWLPDLVRVLTGQVRGSVQLEPGVLTLSLADTRHQAIAQSAGVVIFLDATLSRQDLALKLGCDPKAIYVCRQQVPTHDNLTLVQVMDLGRLGLQRGADQQRRVAALVAHYQALDPDTKVIDFKRFTPEGMGAWWRDSRGVNDFTETRTLLLVGTPCRNLADLQAEYAILTGCHDGTSAAFTAFVDRAIQADMHQAIGRLRAHRRPAEPLLVVLLSDFALDVPTQLVQASGITLAAAGRAERLVLAARAAVETLRQRGEKVTQTAVAKVTGYSQQRLSQIWKLLLSLLECSDSKSSNPIGVAQEQVEAALLTGVSQAVQVLLTQECDESVRLEGLQELFCDWLQPWQWVGVWQLLSVQEQVLVLATLLTVVPLAMLTPLDPHPVAGCR